MGKESAPWPMGRPPEAPGSARQESAPEPEQAEPDLAGEADVLPEPAGPGPDDNPDTAPKLNNQEASQLALRMESMLFVSPKPLTARRLAELLDLTSVVPIRKAAEALRESYAGRAFELRETAGGYQLMTRPDFEADVLRLAKAKRAQKLTQGALETLAVIAYKQPITRAELDAIRGAGSDHHLRTLGERGLIRVTGRHKAAGTIGMGAALYGTTTAFLDEFGLGSLAELPGDDALDPRAKDEPPEPDDDGEEGYALEGEFESPDGDDEDDSEDDFGEEE